MIQLKLAVSNIALPAFDGGASLAALASLGFAGVEVAPSRQWRDTWRGLTAAEVGAYARAVETAGLRVVGLHSLFFDHPELGLFRDAGGRSATLEFLVHLSNVCRDLGGRTLVWGSGRRRGAVPAAEARQEAVAFLGEVCRRIESHGTSVCFEPLGPSDTDFVNSAFEALTIAEELDHPAFAVQLDAKSLVENDEARFETFDAVRARLVHFHANQPGLGVLTPDGPVDHAAFGKWLKRIGYTGYVSLEQRQLSDATPLADIERSMAVMRSCYG